MKASTLQEILRAQKGVTADGERYLVSDALHLDVLATTGHDVLTIQKVRQLVVHELHLAVVTEKEESYYLEFDRVVGVRAKASEGRGGGRTGFAAI
jgi:hypothetical protein